MIRGFILFTLFYLAGVLMERLLHVPLPANVIGMALLALALYCKIIKLEWVDIGSRLVLRHMSLFFAPAIVGTMVFGELLRAYWLSLACSIIGSTLLTMLVTGFIVRHWGRGKEASKDDEQNRVFPA
ncbi:CidA/LrgA family protein [Paenibacillus sp. HB172176]|uniref:CidA/LrgA family protein n=1 Tax=Paenibacillus sp. HB172176 TaxID=2493690 RepID=UPI0014398FAD|nr:CidA/LrgA family protein [Paenibacillus sp. HB172176]